MNILILKNNNVEVGRLKGINIKVKRKDLYFPDDLLAAEVIDNDIFTVSTLYMLQYLSSEYTFKEF